MKEFILFSLLVLGGLGIVGNAWAQSGFLYFVPATDTVVFGDTFQVAVTIDTQNEAVGAIAAYFAYPAEKLDVIDLDTVDSVLSVFAEQEAAAGTVRIVGSIQGAGFTGIGKIAVVTFQAKPLSVGLARLSFLADSAVLKRENSQNILSLPDSGNAEFNIIEQGTVPQTSPEPPRELELIISNAVVEREESGNVFVSWNTNKPASSKIEYGMGAEYNFSVFDSKMKQVHSILVTGLESNKTYEFRVQSTTSSGEAATREGLRMQGVATSPPRPPQEQDIEEKTIETVSLTDSEPSRSLFSRFELTRTTLILIVGIPIVVFLGLAFLILGRMRRVG